MKWMNAKLQRAAHDYVAAILEACATCKVKDPLDAIINTDAYPRLQKVPCVEYAIGWIHGVAESVGITAEALWLACVAEIDAKKGRAA